ncbi:hypothetical protein LG329_16470 [Virgibacillus necropolis]|uniref:hypothetical protein n=1 Tax=Virgibacillus necropolis TaxID=163877 RepID=UPI00384FA8C5
MSEGLKKMLLCTLVFPTGVTILRLFIDFTFGNNIELLSYTAVFFGTAFAGLIFIGPLMYHVSKSKEEKK